MRSCRLADGRPFSSRPGSSGSGGYRDFVVECKEGFAFKLHQKGVLRWTFTAVPWHQVPGARQSQGICVVVAGAPFAGPRSPRGLCL